MLNHYHYFLRNHCLSRRKIHLLVEFLQHMLLPIVHLYKIVFLQRTRQYLFRMFLSVRLYNCIQDLQLYHNCYLFHHRFLSLLDLLHCYYHCNHLNLLHSQLVESMLALLRLDFHIHHYLHLCNMYFSLLHQLNHHNHYLLHHMMFLLIDN